MPSSARVALFAILTLSSACTREAAPAYDVCVAPEGGVLAEDDAPLGLALDDTHVYWAAAIPQGSGYVHEVHRVPRAGGAVEVLASSPAEIGALALTDGEVVWLETSSSTGTGHVYALPKAGDARRELAALDTLGPLDGFALQVDAQAAFVLAQDFGGAGFTYTLFRVPLDGGAPLALASHSLDFGTDVRSLLRAPDGALLWAFPSGPILRADAQQPGDPATLVDAPDGVDGWAIGNTRLYYLSAGAAWSLPTTGGAPTTIDGAVNTFRALAAGPDWIAWGARGHSEESIGVRLSDGRTCTPVAAGVVSAYSTATDGKTLYWTNTASRTAGGGVHWLRIE